MSRLLAVALRSAALAVGFGLCTVVTVRVASLPAEFLAGNVLNDDAFYYTVPARHFIEGRGYSFDGETRTNGVQPLWAALCVGLAAVLPDSAMPHAIVLLCGLFWMAAGMVLYRALRAYDPWFAVFVATGWLLTGFITRLALQGMENGLHAFLFASIIAFGIRRLRASDKPVLRADRPAFYLELGLLLALFALARVDSAMLALFMGILVLAGLVRPGGDGRMQWNFWRAFWLALPGVILFFGTLVWSQWYFGTAMPISGRVKLFYEHQWGPVHGGILGELWWHLNFLVDRSTSPIKELRGSLFVAAIVGAAYGLLQLWRRRRQIDWRPTAYGWFVMGWLAFIVAHFAVYASMMPHFTTYGTWYFSPEIMTLWLLYGAAIASCGVAIRDVVQRAAVAIGLGGRRRLPAQGLTAVAACVLLFVTTPILSTELSLEQRHACVIAGRWLDDRLPAGQKVSCFSSGMAGCFASAHQVINLDGLMNDKEYLEKYIKTGQFERYLRDRKSDYFMDYAANKNWRDGSFWGIKLDAMQLVRWWPMANEQSYAVWKLLPESGKSDVLDPCESGCDRVSQIQFAAFVQKRFEVIDEDRWTAPRDGATTKRVVTSIIDPASRHLLHVLVPEAKVASLGLTPRNIDIPRPKHAIFGGVELLGVDMPCLELRHGSRFFITRYWSQRDGSKLSRDATVELRLRRVHDGNGSDERNCLWHETKPCHGTHPFDRWTVGEVVVETYGLAVPADLPSGVYSLVLTIGHARPSNAAKPTNVESSKAEALLTNLQIK